MGDSASRKEEIEKNLQLTAIGRNSFAIVAILANSVREHRIANRPKKERDFIYSDDTLNKLWTLIEEIVPNTNYWDRMTRKIFLDMDKNCFFLQPSMNRTQSNSYFFFLDEKEEKLNCCEEINLSEHTFNVVSTYLNYFKDKKIFNYSDIEIVMSCILHDFGKSISLREKRCNLSDTKKKHEEISAFYIERIIREIGVEYKELYGSYDKEYLFGKEQMNRILIAVRDHHLDNNPEESLAKALQLIDYEARNQEWHRYKIKRGLQ